MEKQTNHLAKDKNQKDAESNENLSVRKQNAKGVTYFFPPFSSLPPT
jgi:hypothetical protein